MQIMAQINQNQIKLGIEQEKVDSENARTAVEHVIKSAEIAHKHREE